MIMRELEKLQEQVNKQNITAQDLRKKFVHYTFYVNQVKLSRCRSKGRRYTNKDKIFDIL